MHVFLVETFDLRMISHRRTDIIGSFRIARAKKSKHVGPGVRPGPCGMQGRRCDQPLDQVWFREGFIALLSSLEGISAEKITAEREGGFMDVGAKL